MSNKFFTLIYGDEIRTAPKKKILPAETFSKLLDASEVLEHIQLDAERYRQDVIKECEILKENAQKEGYEAGYQKWTETLVKLEEEIEKVHQELQQLIIPVAVKAAKKIVAKELEISDTAIVDIVATNLKAVSQHKKITIYVNKEDLEALEKHKSRLKELLENLESLSIRERNDITPGGCIIETEIGIINAQIEHRWLVLEKAFQTLAKTPPTQTPKTS